MTELDCVGGLSNLGKSVISGQFRPWSCCRSERLLRVGCGSGSEGDAVHVQRKQVPSAWRDDEG